MRKERREGKRERRSEKLSNIDPVACTCVPLDDVMCIYVPLVRSVWPCKNCMRMCAGVRKMRKGKEKEKEEETLKIVRRYKFVHTCTYVCHWMVYSMYM